MVPLMPCSTSNISLISGAAFTINNTKNNTRLTRYVYPRKFAKHILSSQRILLPLSTSSSLFLQCRRDCALLPRSVVNIVSATGTDIAVEEPDSPNVDEDSGGASEIPADAVEASEKSSIQSDAGPAADQLRRSRIRRRSEMPPIKNEDLVPGAIFTGKVRTIQPFGAFVDFGAFSDGLVHVSQLSDGFVKDVGSVVSVGQEVKVRLVEANTETGRISLTMREADGSSKVQQRKDTPTVSSDKPSRAPRNTTAPSQNKVQLKKSKFVKGQELEGTVKDVIRSGAYITLSEDEDGFLPASEEANEGMVKVLDGSSLRIGQKVRVHVLRITRGQATLTMKKEKYMNDSIMEIGQRSVHSATNAFAVAFRKNKDIAAFLDEREKIKKAETILERPGTSEKVEGKVVKTETVSDIPELLNQPASTADELVIVPSSVDEMVVDDEASSNKVIEVENVANDDVELESIRSTKSVNAAVQTIEKEVEKNSRILDPEGSLSTEDQIIEEAHSNYGVVNDEKSDSSIEMASQVLSSEVPVDEEVAESQHDDTIVKDEVEAQPSAANEITAPATVEDEDMGAIPNENGSMSSSGGQPVPSPDKANATISPALVKQLREETGAGMMDCKKALSETGGDIIKAQEFLRKKGLASAEKKASRATAEGRIGSYIHDSRIGVLVEVNCETDFVSRGDIFKELVDDLAMQVAACSQVEYLVTEDVPEEIVNKEREIEMQKEDLLSKPEQIRSRIVEGRFRKRLEEFALLEQPYIKNDKVVVKDWVKQTIATIGENIKVKRFVRYNLGEGLERKSQDFAAEVAAQTAAKPLVAPAKEQPDAVEAMETAQKPPAVTVSAALVKQLREETGAGMMDCKKALSETGGDLQKAHEYLRKKGLSAADKKSSRLAAEGRIGSYVHDSRIGVLIEVNCETDFVGRSENFKELVADLAMQVVACPQVQVVSIEDIPENIVNKEKELEMQREDLLSKPENIREKIVEGRVSKRLAELALLEQPFIKNDSVLVKDLVKQTVATLGENIKVRRFVRFTLGETTKDAKIETEG